MPSYLLSLSFLLIVGGLISICLLHQTFISIFISLEIILFGLGLGFNLLSVFFSSGDGYIMALVILTVTAVEAAVGLGLLIVYYNIFYSVSDYAASNYLCG